MIYHEILDQNKKIYAIKKDGETIGQLKLKNKKYFYEPFPDTKYYYIDLKIINDIIETLEGKYGNK